MSKCERCGKKVQLLKNGKLRKHHVQRGSQKILCKPGDQWIPDPNGFSKLFDMIVKGKI